MTRHLITSLLLLATIAKVTAVLSLGPASIEKDARGYWELSGAVIDGDTLMISHPIAYRTPAYPWFLAITRSVFGVHSLSAIVAIQGAMTVATLWIAGLIAVEITRSPWALPTTLLVSIPAVSAITYSATLLTESLFTFWLMTSSLGVLGFYRRPGFAVAAVTGFLFALMLLTRPIAIYLWVAHLVLLIGIGFQPVKATEQGATKLRKPLQLRLGQIGVAVFTALIVISPWLARNQHLFGTPFLTEFLGRNVWIVTFQDGSGAGLDLPNTEQANELMSRLKQAGIADKWRATWHVSNGLVATGSTDPEADRLMKEVAFAAIADNPAPFAYKFVRRTVNFWRCAVTDLPIQGSETGQYLGQSVWSVERPLVRSWIDHRISRHVWANTLITSIIAAAVILLILNSGTRRFGVWLGLTFAYFSLVTGLVEIPNYRYRIVLEPLAAATAASAAIVLARNYLAPQETESKPITTGGADD